jgi:Zinc carboxypeptidase
MNIVSQKHKLLIILSLHLFLITNSDLKGAEDEKIRVSYVDCFFENASPLSWKIQGDTILKVFLLADYERESLNRQTDHWYFKLDAEKGSHVRIILSKMMADVYNGNLATNWWNFKNDISCYISYDQKTWEAVRTSKLPNMELLVDFMMKGESVYIARMPPYTISDLENLKKRIVPNSLVKIHNIGFTVEKRPLEIIQLGDPNAPNSIIIRARAHPWEAGGNWVVEGLINKFISQDSREWQETFCVYIMPMANKDGVAHGMTRFNLSGKDLNRKWDSRPDSILCPENYALESFITGLIKRGIKPCFGIDIHNDDGGGIILAEHSKDDKQFLKNMQTFEKLMRVYTSFSEKVRYSWKTPGQSNPNVSFEDGLTARYGIESIVYELNANWISSLEKMPSEYDWMKVGEDLNIVFYEFCRALNK